MKYSKSWDKKEDFINGQSRSRARETDKIRSLRLGDVHRSSLGTRERSRTRSNDDFRDNSRDRSREMKMKKG